LRLELGSLPRDLLLEPLEDARELLRLALGVALRRRQVIGRAASLSLEGFARLLREGRLIVDQALEAFETLLEPLERLPPIAKPFHLILAAQDAKDPLKVALQELLLFERVAKLLLAEQSADAIETLDDRELSRTTKRRFEAAGRRVFLLRAKELRHELKEA